MAHNINFNEQTGKHSFFSVKEKAWHGLGQIVEDYPNSAEALKYAGLDFTVEKRKLFTYGNENEEFHAAGQMNIAIVKTSISLGEFAIHYKDMPAQLRELRQELSGRINEHDEQLNSIYEAPEILLDKVTEKEAAKDRWEGKGREGKVLKNIV